MKVLKLIGTLDGRGFVVPENISSVDLDTDENNLLSVNGSWFRFKTEKLAIKAYENILNAIIYNG